MWNVHSWRGPASAGPAALRPAAVQRLLRCCGGLALAVAGCAEQAGSQGPPGAAPASQPLPLIGEVAGVPRALQETTAGVLREVDPRRPFSDASAEVGAAARAFEAKVNELDIQQVNEQLAQIGAVLDSLQRRVERIPPDIGQQVADQVAAANLAGVSRETMQTLQTARPALSESELLLLDARDQLARLDLGSVTAAVESVHVVAATLNRQLAALDLAAANQTVREAALLRPRIDESLVELNSAVAQVRARVAELNVEQIGQETTRAARDVGLAAAGVAGAAGGLRLTVWLLNGLLAALIALTIQRLIAFQRRRSGP